MDSCSCNNCKKKQQWITQGQYAEIIVSVKDSCTKKPVPFSNVTGCTAFFGQVDSEEGYPIIGSVHSVDLAQMKFIAASGDTEVFAPGEPVDFQVNYVQDGHPNILIMSGKLNVKEKLY